MIKLINTNLKRLTHYIPHILIASIILVTSCFGLGLLVSKNLYDSGTSFENVSVAFYIPEDSDKKYNSFALGMMQSMDSISDTLTLVEVSSKQEGYELLENGDVSFLVLIPDMFFTGIMNGTNPSISLIIADNNDMTAYIANELIFSYASYLGIAQAGIYSSLDTMWDARLDEDLVDTISDNVNIEYLNRALDKDDFIEKIEPTNEGIYTLEEHYLAVAVFLCLFFTTFVLMPYLQGYRKKMIEYLELNSYSRPKIIISNIIGLSCGLYLSFIVCFIGISIYSSSVKPIGLISIIPVIITISVITCIIAHLCDSEFAANLIILTLVLILAYCGGGLLPSAFLPKIVNSISSFLPGKYLIKLISYSLF